MDSLSLGFGASFPELATRDGLVRLDRLFVARLAEADPDLHLRLMQARATPDALDARAEGELVVAAGPHVQAFVGELFGIEAELDAIFARTQGQGPLHGCKRLFVQRQAVKKYADASGLDGPALRAELEARMGEASLVSRGMSRRGRPRVTRRAWISRCAMPPGRR
jgi:hypothetical protein